MAKDNFIGTTGDDIYLVDNAGDTIAEAADGGTDTVIASVTYTLPANVENLTLAADGGHHNGVGNALDNVMIANSGYNIFWAGDGNDTLVASDGGSDYDGLNGEAGDDTAVFAHNLADYAIKEFGESIIVAGPANFTYLSGIEHLQFADGTIDVVDDGDPMFDALHYLSHNPDVFHAGVNPLDHFNMIGWQEGRDPNAYFDTSGYRTIYHDVAYASGIESSVALSVNPLDHYHQVGWKMGHDPSAWFDTTLYLINNPDVAAAGIDPLQHFLEFGIAQDRDAYAAIGASIVNGFDAEYYLWHNPDVAAAGIDPLFHFNVVGWQEGRDPNGWFDTAGYLAQNPDVAAAGINPLLHYELAGWTEGRDPSTGFDTLGYLAANPDVAAAGMNPLDHFLQFGIYEGRAAVNDGMWS